MPWLLALLVASCAAPSNDDVVATSAQAVMFEQPTQCSAATLSGTCRGPWAYQLYTTPCWAYAKNAACGQRWSNGCQRDASCLHTETGLSAQRERAVTMTCRQTSSGTTCSRSLALRCLDVGNGFLASALTTNPPVTATMTRALVGSVTRSTEDISFGVFLHEYTQTCRATLTNAGVGPHPVCGQETYRCRVNNTCRTEANGEAPLGECGTDPTWHSRDPGRSYPQLQAELPYLDPTRADCSTLEPQPVDATRLATTMARLNPQDPFWTTLPAPPAQEAEARQHLARNAKLMFELGHATTGISSDAVRALYATPADQHTCGVSAVVPVTDSCRAWGASAGLAGPIGLCQRMLSDHVAPARFDSELDRCLDLLAVPALAGSDPCAVEHRDVVEALAERLLAKADPFTKPPGTTAVLGLTAALRHIDRWYAGAAAAHVRDPAVLADATGRVLSQFWTRVYQAGAAAPVAFPSAADGSEATRAQLAQLFALRLEVERQVLNAAFADPAPLDEAPLLLVTADALTSLNEHLRTAAPLYDFACRVRGRCDVGEANEATRLIRLIGALGNDATLAAALAGAETVRADWRSTFTALRARRGALETAYRKASDRPAATLDELHSASVVPAAAGLAELVVAGSTMWQSYAKTGELLPRDGNLIRASLSDAKRAATATQFRQRGEGLHQARQEYQLTRGTFANTVLELLAAAQYQGRLDAETRALRRDYDNVVSDLEGLMASQGHADRTLGSFMARYLERASAPGWLPSYPIAGESHLMQVGAIAARSAGAIATVAAVPAVAVLAPDGAAPWQLAMGKGDLLSFNVSGSWAPSCALRSTTLAGPTGTTTGFVDPTGALTGPEGYTVSWENGRFRASEHSSSDFASQSDSTSVCGSVSADLLTVLNGAVPVGSLSVTASKCRQWQTGHTENDSTSNGARFAYGANFAGGLRIPGTPFPQLPGASLLLVQVIERADGPHIRDVQVVGRDATFLFPEAVTVYLVVNDRAGCTPLDGSQLTVNYVKGQSVAAASLTLATAMADVLARLTVEASLYVAQGSVTGAELAALQVAAYDQLRVGCPDCNLAANEEVRAMFDAWLSAQLASIERKTRIASAQRELDRLVLRLAALASDAAGSADSQRLLTLLTTWQLQHLGYHQLHEQAALVLDYGNSYVLPMLTLRYPQALAMLRGSSTAAINGLRTADWTLPYDELAVRLEVLAGAVAVRLDEAVLVGEDSMAPIMVRFPKPDHVAAPGDIDFNVADPARLADVWESCAPVKLVRDRDGVEIPGSNDYCLKPQPVFTVSPEDLYADHEAGQLFCSEAAPIVRAMAFFAANQGHSGNDNWNRVPRRRFVKPSQDVMFTTEQGVFGYRVERPTGIGVRVLAGRAEDVWTAFQDHALADRDVDGRSPFGTFSVDLGSYATDHRGPVGDADAIIVVFDVETRAALGPLAGVRACVAAP